MLCNTSVALSLVWILKKEKNCEKMTIYIYYNISSKLTQNDLTSVSCF